MKEKDIYILNKSLYKTYSREILSATQYINNLYPDFDGDKKVFENTEKFENGKEIWMPNNKGHEFCHLENEYVNGYVFFFKIWYPNHAKISYNLRDPSCRLYLAFQERLSNDDYPELKGYPEVDLFRIEYNRGLDKWLGFGDDNYSYYDLKKDEAIKKFNNLILDHAKVIEKSKKKFSG